jgi:hypothetical protein
MVVLTGVPARTLHSKKASPDDILGMLLAVEADKIEREYTAESAQLQPDKIAGAHPNVVTAITRAQDNPAELQQSGVTQRRTVSPVSQIHHRSSLYPFHRRGRGDEVPPTGEFRLSITKALGDQLAAALERLTPASLQAVELAKLQPRGGVYQLYHDGEFVYVGKADRSLPDRLGDHLRKISGRVNISLNNMGFTAMYVEEDLSAVAPETLLINRYKATGGVPWNLAGFGNNDPGRERDTSRVEPPHFDALYPANLELACDGILAGTHTVANLLRQVKTALPFVFRYQDGNRRVDAQPAIYRQTTVNIPFNNPTADTVFTAIADAMPSWQITALPGYVIMYHEQRNYPSARKVYP